jgi:hypothetical protein
MFLPNKMNLPKQNAPISFGVLLVIYSADVRSDCEPEHRLYRLQHLVNFLSYEFIISVWSKAQSKVTGASLSLKKEKTFFPFYAMMWRYTPLIHFSTRWRWINFTFCPLYPWDVLRYPLNTRLGRPQNPSGEEKTLLALTGFEPRSVQPADFRYTYYSTLYILLIKPNSWLVPLRREFHQPFIANNSFRLKYVCRSSRWEDKKQCLVLVPLHSLVVHIEMYRW